MKMNDLKLCGGGVGVDAGDEIIQSLVHLNGILNCTTFSVQILWVFAIFKVKVKSVTHYVV